MLDLRLIRARTTQGEPPADMTLPGRPPAADAAPVAGLAAPEPTAPLAVVDARAVADRVYALFETDLRQQRERRGGR